MKQVIFSGATMLALLSLTGCGGGSGGGGETLSRIVYAHEDPLSKNIDLYTIRPDGTEKTRLTTERSNDVAPDLSPDGTKVVYLATDRISVINIDGTGNKELRGTNVGHTAPRWSPDGKKIVFTAIPETGGRASVYVMDAAGGAPTRISKDESAQYGDPDFSPDGKKIVCTRFAVSGVRRGLVIMNADGSGETAIKTVTVSRPRFSPDGSRILYRIEKSGSLTAYDLGVIRVDGTEDTALGTGVASGWSPDGAKILFASENSTSSILYVVNADGTGKTLLGTTSETGFDASY